MTFFSLLIFRNGQRRAEWVERILPYAREHGAEVILIMMMIILMIIIMIILITIMIILPYARQHGAEVNDLLTLFSFLPLLPILNYS